MLALLGEVIERLVGGYVRERDYQLAYVFLEGGAQSPRPLLKSLVFVREFRLKKEKIIVWGRLESYDFLRLFAGRP